MCLCMGCGSLLLKPASFVACKVVVALRRINNSNKAENQYTKTTQLTTLGVAKIHTSLGKMQYTKSETALISLVSFYNLFFFFFEVLCIQVSLNMEILTYSLSRDYSGIFFKNKAGDTELKELFSHSKNSENSYSKNAELSI